MWKGNLNMHDTLDREYLKKEFLRISGEGTDNSGRIKLSELVKDKGSILDVACGTCINYELMKGLDYSGYDLTQQMLDIALELYPELTGKLHQGYIQDMPFKDNKYNIVIARHIFEHIPNYKDAMRECLRIAKDYCYFIFYLHPTNEAEDIRYIENKDGSYYMNRYNIEDVERVFKGFEFKKYETADTIYEVKL